MKPPVQTMTGRAEGHAGGVRRGRVAGCGLSLAYRCWQPEAPGLPLLLLHGIGGSGADWEPVVRSLAPRPAYALDARGHGQSDWDGDEAYGGDQHFADVAMALEGLGIERCIVAGFSMGGAVAILAAAALPARVAGVVVIDNYPHPRMTPGSRRIAGWISRLDGEGRGFDPAIARQFRRMLAAGADERLDLRGLWESVQCPALVVRGEHSDVLPVGLAEEMVRTQAQARLETIAGARHRIPGSHPAPLAALLARFAAEVEVGSAGEG